MQDSSGDFLARISSFGDPWRVTWRRRLVTIPLFYLVGTLIVVLLPLLALAGLVTAAFERHPFARLRFIFFLAGYFGGEMLFLFLLFLQWVFLLGFLPGSQVRLAHAAESLSNAWGRVLYQLGVWSFDLRLSFDGLEQLEKPGPLLVLLRHASLGDTPLAPTYLGSRYGFRLRYIVKRELINDPVFDVIGGRLGSCFVRRGSKNSGREIESVCAQLEHLSPRDAVILYPEGTRYTDAKRLQVMAKLERDNPALYARVSQLSHVMPPQLGGAVELLCRNPSADVLIVEHVGYEVAATFGDLVDGRALHQRIEVRFRRIPFAEVPKDREEIISWLLEQWTQMDQWVGQRKPHVITKSAPDLPALTLGSSAK
ncbi:MAG TPA: 1-acyl-sn-glycerol-3-phosphate acyltransferase [Pseudomonadota bacterium]|nr:1-acyl-sn-glycerol-3-phosphate acyltransferase [Pseudomonadota bacterium]HNN52916.1 1-acyl-sn-glycerol-3-phosphate acyltransferase [Pseudomonadota bacterium]HNO67702.1 1-acyl-sn-glycerol-3-phosphate acyltransferase [Pseudomonadota bacterium]